MDACSFGFGCCLVSVWFSSGSRLVWFWSCSCLRVCFRLVLWLSAEDTSCGGGGYRAGQSGLLSFAGSLQSCVSSQLEDVSKTRNTIYSCDASCHCVRSVYNWLHAIFCVLSATSRTLCVVRRPDAAAVSTCVPATTIRTFCVVWRPHAVAVRTCVPTATIRTLWVVSASAETAKTACAPTIHGYDRPVHKRENRPKRAHVGYAPHAACFFS
jgi:hypothetical protein